MTLHIGNITFDCENPQALAQFIQPAGIQRFTLFDA